MTAMFQILVIAALFTAAAAKASLHEICTSSFVRAALPAKSIVSGVTINALSVETTLVANASFSSSSYPSATLDYCNVTFAYSHDNIPGDVVHVTYWLPSARQFQNRYVSTGGGGLAINSGKSAIPSGVIAGAVSGITDGGFGNFNTMWNKVFLQKEGVINWQATRMFGFQAHHELATLGKQFARNIYNVTDNRKVYSYYQGCSEGGREGWSQVQRFADQFDGAAIGAPAIRYGQQQVNHLVGNIIEQTMGYFPPLCELEKIATLTIAACDGLDGRVDGIVSRSDLCKLHFNINTTIGTSYRCEASSGASFPFPGGLPGGLPNGPLPRSHTRRQFPPQNPTPAQSGTVTAEGVAVVSAFLNGLFDSQGRRAYISWQHGTIFDDAKTAYNANTHKWGVSINGLGGEWAARFLQLKDTSSLESLNGLTYDTLKEWMVLGMDRYGDTLQTTYPNLTEFRSAGGKVLHFHGEQDNSIPTAASVRYYESVRTTMYPGQTFNQSVAALDGFYRLFLVPGAGHCGSNSAQPGSPWPQTTLQTVIDWVEKGSAPETLTAKGKIDTICRWPLRPMWSVNGTVLNCEYHQPSLDSWVYELDAYDVPVY
ncbi:Tannase/feruloyl esterase [Lasiosphaeria hispida]|uniref:Carboxylic ester hydrolase n=1 Tax=Lasiosphaeria hispida TaxID=260671 RepID=A0AAJ0HK70_9PEZI|nr:Tannase/feruloyl esterase [Lasiosphaeria hispida]